MSSTTRRRPGLGRNLDLSQLGLLALGLLLAGPLLPTATAAEVRPGVQAVQYRDYDSRGSRYDDRRSDDRRSDDRRNDGGRNDGGRGRSSAPGGSYLQSCGDARVDGSTLVAICKGGRGSRFETSLDLSRCGRSDIGNNNGTLQCAGTRGGSRRID